MEHYRQPKPERLELETPQPLIPTQRRNLQDDETDSDFVAAILEPVLNPPQPALSERESAILTFEKQWWRHAGAKEQAIKDSFGMSGTRYYQLLNALLDKPAALEHDPVLVGRLRRLRGSRSRARGLKGS